MTSGSTANPEIVAMIASLQTSMQHLEKSSKEIRDQQEKLTTELQKTREDLAAIKGGLGERGKLGDWLVSALISVLTSAGILGVAKAFRHD
jgi:hypothetical protein